MYQQLWGYKVEEKLYLGVREQKKVEYHWSCGYCACHWTQGLRVETRPRMMGFKERTTYKKIVAVYGTRCTISPRSSNQ
jgi:hypothetical protein